MSIDPGSDAPPPHIRYSSSNYVLQPVQRRNPKLAYQAVLDLLNSCTDWSGEWPGGRLSVFESGSFVETPYDVEAMIAEFTAVLGEHRSTFRMSALEGGQEQRSVEWSYSGAQHVAFANRLFLEPHVPTKGIFALSMECALKVGLRDPRSGASLTPAEYDPHGQLPPTHIELQLSPSGVRLGLGLVFPFASPNEAFLDALRAIRPYLPVRLGKASFTHVQPLNAKKERRHKLSVGLFDGI